MKNEITSQRCFNGFQNILDDGFCRHPFQVSADGGQMTPVLQASFSARGRQHNPMRVDLSSGQVDQRGRDELQSV